MEQFFKYLLETFFVIVGIQFVYTGYKVFKDTNNSKRIGSSLFWLDLGILFMLGKVLPNLVNGILVVILGVITLFKQFEVSSFATPSQEKLEK